MANDLLPGLEDPPGGISSNEWAATPQPVRTLVRGLLSGRPAPATLPAADLPLAPMDGSPAAPATGESPVDPPAEAGVTPPLGRVYAASPYVWLGLLALAVVIFLRLFKLETLQNEMYDDIGFAYDYVNRIREGERPTNFVLSTGPLFHYLATPMTWLVGFNYLSLKLTTVLLSLLTIWGTFGLARRLLDDRLALLAAFISGVSSWMLIFSRIGNLIIMYPLLTALALWLLARAVQHGRRRDIIACAVVSALGLYTHPSTFFLPVAVGLTYLCLLWTTRAVRWRQILLFGVAGLIASIPFLLIVRADPETFFGAYIGGKLETSGDVEGTLLSNLGRALFALHVRGDGNFRSNPVGQPHLDTLSGLLFLFGVAFWLRRERRRWAPLLFVPLLILQVPATLVISRPDEVPSASRTFGVAPIVYILVASGLCWLLDFLRERMRSPAEERLPASRRPSRWVPAGVVLLALASILALNAQRYFRDYVAGLPYENTPIGRHVADYIESLPPDTRAYVVGCCWEYNMPEQGSVDISLSRPERMAYLDPNSLTCDELSRITLPAVLIWSFHKQIPGPQTATCVGWLPSQVYASPSGLPVFRAAPLIRDPLTPEMVAVSLMDYNEVELEGAILQVRHSKLDQGSLPDLFDASTTSLIRGSSANPLVLELTFPAPRSIGALGFDFATMHQFKIDAELVPADGGAPIMYTQSYERSDADPHVDFPLPEVAQNVQTLKLQITYFSPPPGDVHIHVRGLQIR